VISTFQQVGDETGMQGMAGTPGDQAAENRLTDKSKVTEKIENLVANEFVFESERLFIEHPGVGQNNGIFQRTTLNETVVLQGLHLIVESECPGRSD